MRLWINLLIIVGSGFTSSCVSYYNVDEGLPEDRIFRRPAKQIPTASQGSRLVTPFNLPANILWNATKDALENNNLTLITVDEDSRYATGGITTNDNNLVGMLNLYVLPVSDSTSNLLISVRELTTFARNRRHYVKGTDLPIRFRIWYARDSVSPPTTKLVLESIDEYIARHTN